MNDVIRHNVPFVRTGTCFTKGHSVSGEKSIYCRTIWQQRMKMDSTSSPTEMKSGWQTMRHSKLMSLKPVTSPIALRNLGT